MTRDLWLEHMEHRSGCNDEPERDELSNDEALSRDKCELIGASERVAQLVASAAASFYHTHLSMQIEQRIGPGDPLDRLLWDSFYRNKFNAKARKW